MRKIVRRQPLDRSRDRSIAAILAVAALAVPSIAVADEGTYCVRVPPGQSIRLKVPPADPNEPTPIIIEQVGPDIGGVGVALLGRQKQGVPR